MPVNPDITLLYPVIGYFVIMAAVGVWAYQRADSAEDFILAGRGLGTVVVAGTLMATWLGSGTVTGGGNSIAYSFGIWPAMLYGSASLIGIAILWLLASQIRGYNSYTIPEILDEGIGREAKAVGFIIIALAYIGIVAYQFTGLGFVLNVTTGIPIETGALIAAVMIIGLAMAGGLFSVAYTDAISSFLMVFGLLLAVPFALSNAGGWTGLTTDLPASYFQPLGTLSFIQFLGYWAPLFLLLLGDQTMYQRITAGESDEATNRAMVGWFIGILAASILVPIIAFTARSIFPNIEPGMAMISMATVIPTWIGGILLAATSAFVVSTGTSFLLSASTNISQDFYKGFINQDASDQRIKWLTRMTVLVLGVLAYVLGQYFPTILSLQILAYTAYGAAITPAVLAVFLMREQLTKTGGVLGMIVGFVVTVLWASVLSQPFGISAVIVSAPIAAIVIVGGSWLTSSSASQVESPG